MSSLSTTTQRTSIFLLAAMLLGIMSAPAISAWSCTSDDNCTMGDSYDFGMCTPDNFVDAKCIQGTCTYSYQDTNCFGNDLTTSIFISNHSKTCIATDNQTTDCTLTQGELDPICYTETGTCDQKTLSCIAPPVNDTTGPTTLNVTFTKATSQCEIKIDAFAEDKCSAVTNGEFFMGGSTCGPPGAGQHFDSITELKDTLSELIKNSASTTDGSHNIFIRAQDSQDNWGSCFASHIDIDCNPPEYPTCDIGNTVYNGHPDGIVLQGTCNPNEKITCGDNVTIQANICDSESKIQLAEYFLDDQPLLNWGGTNMSASDGSFNEKCEDVTATIDTTKLSDGTHYVKVHGKDGQENWGKFDPFTNASFIKDTTPPKTVKELYPADKESIKCDISSAYGYEITDGCAYVKPGTNITLSAYDFNPDNNANGGYNDLPGQYSGNVTIHWNIYYSEDCLVNDPSWSLQSSGTGDLNKDVQLNLTEDSCHLIEYWATDGVCSNEETHHYELDIVDGKAPVSNKTIGDPKVIKGQQCFPQNDSVLKSSFSNGENLRQISGAYSRGSCSVNTGIAFDGKSLLVTCWYYNTIDFLDPSDGSLQKAVNVSAVEGIGAVSWDASRNMLWGCEHGTNNVVLINTTTGASTVMFHSNGCIDGLAYDGVDDTIWASPDANSALTHYTTNGTIISVQNSGMSNSGIAVGGSKLYLADNGGQHIYEANKDLSNKQLFASFPARLEDLECDDLTFAGEGSGAIWSLDAYDRTINAWAIPQGQCGFGGLPPPPVCEGNETYVYVTQKTPINLSCSDQNPHPVGDETLYYRYNIQEDFNDKPGEWTKWMIYEGPLTFSEDSIHNLQWYCVDGLGNTETVHNETDIVDTEPPEINKTLSGPHSGECLPPNLDRIECLDGRCVPQCMLSSSTEIHVNAADPLPHPVDTVSCNWSYTVDGEPMGGGTNVPAPFTINFPEESHHVLTIVCEDALGNMNRDVEDFYVDKTPPETTKDYIGPYVELTDGVLQDHIEPVHWINSSTEIKLSATDTIGPHVSGVNYTKYRVTLVNDTYCWNQALCQEAQGSGAWSNYDEQFTIKNESCHLIEYYSSDNVNNTETIRKQCAFVDNTPPETNKTIGSPNYTCSSEDENQCGPETNWQPYYVNESTPINISCQDQNPHPVGNEELCYKVSWHVDRETCSEHKGVWNESNNFCYITNEFGETNKNGYFCTEDANYTFQFKEDSLHNIEWYCTDGLGNRGPLNLEYDNVDSNPPWIVVDNPTPSEAENVTRCMQSIVIEAGDTKSGVNASSVYAQLLDNESNIVEDINLNPIQTAPGAYEALMAKDHPVGNYTLKICASDNVGNEYCKEIPEYLPEMVSVSFIDPSTCIVDPNTGGQCNFMFNLCMRDGNTIQFWLDKFGDAGITPYMMNATINKTDTTYVGLRHAQTDYLSKGTCEAAGHTWLDNACWTIFPAGELQLEPICNINGEDSFNLHLNITGDVAEQLGSGVQILKYWINTSSQCVVPD